MEISMKLFLKIASLIGGLSLLLLLFASYFYSHELLHFVATKSLAAQDIEVRTLEIEKLSLGELKLIDLELSSPAFQLQAKDISVIYSLNGIRSGLLDSLEITTLRLELFSSEPQEEPSDTEASLSSLQNLPLSSLQITELTVNSQISPQLSASLHGSLLYQSGVFKLGLARDSSLTTEDLVQLQSPLRLKLESDSTLTLDPKTEELSISETEWKSTNVSLSEQFKSFSAEPVTLTSSPYQGTLSKLELLFSLSVASSKLLLDSKPLRFVNTSVKGTLHRESLSATLSSQLQQPSTKLRASLHHSFLNGTGETSLSLDTKDLQSIPKQSYLGTLLGKQKLELRKGELRGTTQILWQDSKLTFKPVKITAQKINASYNGVDFKNASSNTFLIHPTRFEILKPLELKVEKIGNSLALENLSIELLPKKNPASKESLFVKARAELLGGQISLAESPLSWPQLSVVLELEKLDLGKILSLYKEQGVSGSGELSGRLPLALAGSELEMKSGLLWSTGPGKIRYQPSQSQENVAEQQSQLQFVVNALKNYHYQSLSSVAEYKKNGDLLVSVALKGHNPEVSTSQPIHLNVSVEQNVLSLLKSLRIPSTIEESLMKEKKHGGKM